MIIIAIFSIANQAFQPYRDATQGM
jgi:hypothetical protein